MPKTHIIKKEEAQEIEQARKGIRDKQVDKRLHAVQLRGEGKKNPAIAAQLETTTDVVSKWVSIYRKGGLDALLPKERLGNRRNMSVEAEAALLGTFTEKAEKGQVVEVSAIEAAYAAAVGHRIGSGQIYRVLKRHEWRKVKPRSKHPKSATPEVIEASKKLTLE